MTTTARARRRSPRAPAVQPAGAAGTALLYRHSAWLFLAFAAAMLVAFWPSYYSRLGAQPSFHPHAHGLAMTAWCALLAAQAWLVRSGRRPLHRTLGRASYVLVPLIVISTVNFLHFRLQGATPLGSTALYFVALVLNALVAFLALYGLAIWHRRTAATHARYMIGTLFPLFTPVTDRLIARHVPSIVPLVPLIDGTPILPVAGFLLADAILIALSIWDWRTSGRLVFPVALGILLLYHASVLTFYRLPAWHTFAAWFAGLPLS